MWFIFHQRDKTLWAWLVLLDFSKIFIVDSSQLIFATEYSNPIQAL